MTKTNQYGLSRNIPENVKRQIRQECYFGCVICGFGYCQYEHISPEFKDAKKHDPSKMALLCDVCHGQVTSRRITKEKVEKARENPVSLKKGNCKAFFDFNGEHPKVIFGGVTFVDIPEPVKYQGVPLLKIEKSEHEDEPFLLSCTFKDASGKNQLSIHKNEWIVDGDAIWDLNVVGQLLTIRQGKGNIQLQLRTDPPYIKVERLKMKINDVFIEVKNEELMINNQTQEFLFQGCEIVGNGVGTGISI